jgi:hypothetical protein
MSHQSDARKGEAASDEWRVGSKGRRVARPYLIEWRCRKPDSDQWNKWRKRKRYATREERDLVLAKYLREPRDTTQYRAVDPPSETQYLLSSPANAADLQQAMDDLDCGKGVEFARADQISFARALIDPPAPNKRLVRAAQRHANLIQPPNAADLQQAMDDLDRGRGIEFDPTAKT